MFSQYTGSQLLSSTFSAPSTNLAAVATSDPTSKTIFVALINYYSTNSSVTINFNNVPTKLETTKAHILTSASPTDENTPAQPSKIVPMSSTRPISSPYVYSMPANSLTILEIAYL